MSKRKRQPRPGRESTGSTTTKKSASSSAADRHDSSFFSRDNVENILIAILLALLFRAFEAEAFVIPTGSMAPSLMGRHKDLRCEQCGIRFQTGESESGTPEARTTNSSAIRQVVCPTCRFPNDTKSPTRRNVPYTGDRILVNKFAYAHQDPERWDVIVFKYPGNRKQNYIKRLVGLPHEVLRIRHGDIFVGPDEDSRRIARKPHHKLPHILQLVHDTHHIAPRLMEAGWPSFWFDDGPEDDNGWEVSQDQRQYQLNAHDDNRRWLRYRHVMPTEGDWAFLQRSPAERVETDQVRPGLVTDFYAYNAAERGSQPANPVGWHWVGDLAVEADIQVRSDQGMLLLDLVEGGRHHICTIDVATGTATVSMDGGRIAFEPERAQAAPTELTAATPITQSGPYRIRWANVDDQLSLWIDDRVVQWQASEQPHQATYATRAECQPRWSPDDPGDLYPVGIGGEGVDLSIHRLRVLRDVYYVVPTERGNLLYDYDYTIQNFLKLQTFHRELLALFSSPEQWDETQLFAGRSTSAPYVMDADQFFPMGDNSPFSKDARVWSEWVKTPSGYPPLKVPPYVPRELLIGKAFLVYWPHGWDLGPIPIRAVPNFNKMKWIR